MFIYFQDHIPSNIPIEDNINFINAGGNSLRAVQLSNCLENVVRQPLPLLLDLLLNKTFGDVKKYLLSVTGQSKQSSEVHTVNNSDKISKSEKSFSVVTSVDSSLSRNIMQNSRGAGKSLSECLLKRRKSAQLEPDRDLTCVSLFNDGVDSETQKCKKRHGLPLFSYSVSRCNRVFPVNCGDEKKTNCSRDNIVKKINRLKSGTLPYRYSLREVWRYNTGKCIDASPLVAVTSANR